MKIAVMMRVMDQDTGLGFFTRALLRTLLQKDTANSYLLLYKEAKHFGAFAGFSNAKELLLPSRHKLVWDQVVVPLTAWRERADVIYNPKFSVPLLSHCPVAMGLQEPAWWAIPEHHTWADRMYMRTMLPLYCRRASRFFPWSQFILEENRKYLALPLRQATVTYTACDPSFGHLYDETALREFRAHYQLPEKFILSVTRVENLGNASSTFSGTKNVETTLRAFQLIRERVPHKLVIVGRRVKEYLEHVGWHESELEGVTFTGFISRGELPKMYAAAALFVLPSFYEGCGATMIEAMTCGCPIVASSTGACPEVSAGAAILANPHDVSDFAAKMLVVLNDRNLANELREKGLNRARFFNWERIARVTLDGLTRVASNGLPVGVAGLGIFEAAFVFLVPESGLPDADPAAISFIGCILEIAAWLPWWFAHIISTGSARAGAKAEACVKPATATVRNGV
jgi:glycosyltransferase involved in cell wall biosynthesis